MITTIGVIPDFDGKGKIAMDFVFVFLKEKQDLENYLKQKGLQQIFLQSRESE